MTDDNHHFNNGFWRYRWHWRQNLLNNLLLIILLIDNDRFWLSSVVQAQSCMRHDPNRVLSNVREVRKDQASGGALACAQSCITNRSACRAALYHQFRRGGAVRKECTIYDGNTETGATIQEVDLGPGESYNLYQLVADCSSRGDWQSWSKWTTCTADCGAAGTRQRTRNCISGDCPGPSVEPEDCVGLCPTTTSSTTFFPPPEDLGEAPETVTPPIVITEPPRATTTRRIVNRFTTWSEWGTCSVSCGLGRRQRERSCIGRSSDCSSDQMLQSKICDLTPCLPTPPPAPAPRSSFIPGRPRTEIPASNNINWSSWSTCSRTCGLGEKIRTRPLSVLSGNGNRIEEEAVDCINQPCDGEWAPWQLWSQCSVSCGVGTRTRIRSCVGDRSNCVQGEPFDVQDCTVSTPCGDSTRTAERKELWQSWKAWGECSSFCGNGFRERMRICGGLRGDECPGRDREFESCSGLCGARPPPDQPNQSNSASNQNAPTCIWTQWSGWGQCSTSCGHGRLSRQRECSCYGLGEGRNSCSGDRFEYVACSKGPCSFWEDWSSWSPPCQSHSYGWRFGSGGGRHQFWKRRRRYSSYTSNTPTPTRYSSSSSHQASGTEGQQQQQHRTRACINGHLCEGSGRQSRECHGVSSVLEPPATSYSSSQYQYQKQAGVWNPPQHGPSSYIPSAPSPENYYHHTLPAESTEDFISISNYKVSKHPTAAVKSTRETTGAAALNPSSRLLFTNSKSSSSSAGSTTCSWSFWSPWSDCNVSCGRKGRKSRQRLCPCGFCGSSLGGDKTLDGSTTERETTECYAGPCPTRITWGKWTRCSAECGKGVRSRVRNCNQNRNRTFVCDGSDLETCTSTRRCPSVANRRNTRFLPAAAAGIVPNRDSRTVPPSSRACGGGWSNWAVWSSCSATCGHAYSFRRRQCPCKNRQGRTNCAGSAGQKRVCGHNPPCAHSSNEHLVNGKQRPAVRGIPGSIRKLRKKNRNRKKSGQSPPKQRQRRRNRRRKQ